MDQYIKCSLCEFEQRLLPRRHYFTPSKNTYRSQFEEMWCGDCNAPQMAFMAVGDGYTAYQVSMDDLDAGTIELIHEYESKLSQSGFSLFWFNWFLKNKLGLVIKRKLIKTAAAKVKAAREFYEKAKLDCRCTECGGTNLEPFNPMPLNHLHSCGGYFFIESRPGPFRSRRLGEFLYDSNGFRTNNTNKSAALPNSVLNIGF